MRRTKGARREARCPLDGAMRHFQLMANPPLAGEVQLHVVVSVVSYHVAFAHHAPRENGKATHMVAHHEERGRNAPPRAPLRRAGERLENRRRGSLIRAVVECQIDPTIPGTSLD